MHRNGSFSACILLLLISPLFSSSAPGAELTSQTVEAWRRYVALTEARMDAELKDGSGFLVTEFMSQEDAADCRDKVSKGNVCVERLETLDGRGKKVKVPKGTISHWMGSVRINNAKLDTLIPFVQNYDVHERYFDDIERSRLIARNGDTFKFFYRLKQETLWVTVRYNTTHEVSYRRHGTDRVSSASRTTRILELDKTGKDGEREKPEGKDSGFMWRLNSYWRFQQDGNGVVVTLESLTLSRGIPSLALFVGPIVNKISRGLLENTLLALRNGYHAYLQETVKTSVEPGEVAPETP